MSGGPLNCAPLPCPFCVHAPGACLFLLAPAPLTPHTRHNLSSNTKRQKQPNQHKRLLGPDSAPLSALGVAHGDLLYLLYQSERDVAPTVRKTELDRHPFGAKLTVADIAAKQRRVERQEKAAIESCSFERHAANAFQSYVSNALAFSIKRGGILYGTGAPGLLCVLCVWLRVFACSRVVVCGPVLMRQQWQGSRPARARTHQSTHCKTHTHTHTHTHTPKLHPKHNKRTVDDAANVRVEFVYEPPQRGSATTLALERGTPEEAQVRGGSSRWGGCRARVVAVINSSGEQASKRPSKRQRRAVLYASIHNTRRAHLERRPSTTNALGCSNSGRLFGRAHGPQEGRLGLLAGQRRGEGLHRVGRRAHRDGGGAGVRVRFPWRLAGARGGGRFEGFGPRWGRARGHSL